MSPNLVTARVPHSCNYSPKGEIGDTCGYKKGGQSILSPKKRSVDISASVDVQNLDLLGVEDEEDSKSADPESKEPFDLRRFHLDDVARIGETINSRKDSFTSSLVLTSEVGQARAANRTFIFSKSILHRPPIRIRPIR